MFVVNKSDKPGAQETVRDLRGMIAMAQRGPEDWKPPIVRTVAGRRGHRRAGRQARRAPGLAGLLRRRGAQAAGPGPWRDHHAGTGRAAAADGCAARGRRWTSWPAGWRPVSSTLTARPTSSSRRRSRARRTQPARCIASRGSATNHPGPPRPAAASGSGGGWGASGLRLGAARAARAPRAAQAPAAAGPRLRWRSAGGTGRRGRVGAAASIAACMIDSLRSRASYATLPPRTPSSRLDSTR